MSEAPRMYGASARRLGRAPMSQIEILESQVPAEELEKRRREQQQRELLDQGRRGFTINLADDFDWHTYAPYVVRIADQSVWTRQGGSPPNGYLADTHTVVVPAEDTASWFYLTAARAADPSAPRSVAELEGRKARREQHLGEQAKQAKAELAAKRKTARPVLLADLERGPVPASLREAVEQLDQIGGHVRIEGGRVVVEAPPSTLGGGPFGRGSRLAAILYKAEPALVEVMRGKDGVISTAKASDRPLLPSGRVLP